MQIEVDTEYLAKSAESIRLTASDLENTMKKIENLVLGLGLEWQGKAEVAYTAKLLFVKKQFEVISSFFSDYADLVETTASEFNEVEKQLSFILEV